MDGTTDFSGGGRMIEVHRSGGSKGIKKFTVEGKVDEDFDPSLDDGWKLYHEPVIVNKRYIYVLSTRLGFEDSDIIKKAIVSYHLNLFINHC